MDSLRVTPSEVMERMGRGEPVLLVDARNVTAWAASERQLPGAMRVPADDIDARAALLPRGRPIVTYCTWPNEASSARVARRLSELGFADVHALRGGLDAWRQAGFPDEPRQEDSLGWEAGP